MEDIYLFLIPELKCCTYCQDQPIRNRNKLFHRAEVYLNIYKKKRYSKTFRKEFQFYFSLNFQFYVRIED